ncbi:MAG: ABC transporter ATP-binding protein [Clostridia bacterium]|nr:ABC transporter ATP-binding protein [Clostridia bacterium]
MIEARHLSKSYGKTEAVTDLSFRIGKGEVVGFLGPNGAGKTTTLNMLTGCLSPGAGEVLIDGIDLCLEPVRAKRKIGYLPETPPLYADMTVREHLLFVAAARGFRGAAAEKELIHAARLTGIAGVMKKLIRNLSKGYRQRVGIASAILGDPEIVILDEPTAGLDPGQIVEIRRLVRSLGKEHTVLFSSHILSEVREVSDRVLILSHGRLAADDSARALEERAGEGKLALRVRGEKDKALAAAERVPGIRVLDAEEEETGALRLTLAAGKDDGTKEAIFASFAGDSLPILGMEDVRSGLEEVFLELTREESGGEEGKEGSEA